MPNKPKRKSYRRYLRGKIDEKVDLGTLGAGVVISAVGGGLVQERTFVSSIVATHSLSEFTQAVGDGPISVGVAHSDYTDAEIEAYLETGGTWDEGNKITQEIAKRKIRRIGTFQQVDISLGNSVLNDGRLMKTKLNWIINQGQGLRYWAYNDGESALGTTDPDYNIQGHANLWPR